MKERTRGHKSSRWLDQTGSSEVVMFLGTFPLIIVVILAVLQFTMIGYVLVVTETAARDAARAAGARRNPQDAVDRVVASSGVEFDSVKSQCTGGYVTVTVTGHVPPVAFVARDLFTFTRSVSVPRERNCP